jgi:hypothetical protein
VGPRRPVPRPGGDPVAHPRGALKMHALGDDWFVSGQRDGALRFWDRKGLPRTGGGQPLTHRGEVWRVFALEDGELVTATSTQDTRAIDILER